MNSRLRKATKQTGWKAPKKVNSGKKQVFRIVDNHSILPISRPDKDGKGMSHLGSMLKG